MVTTFEYVCLNFLYGSREHYLFKSISGECAEPHCLESPREVYFLETVAISKCVLLYASHPAFFSEHDFFQMLAVSESVSFDRLDILWNSYLFQGAVLEAPAANPSESATFSECYFLQILAFPERLHSITCNVFGSSTLSTALSPKTPEYTFP